MAFKNCRFYLYKGHGQNNQYLTAEIPFGQHGQLFSKIEYDAHGIATVNDIEGSDNPEEQFPFISGKKVTADGINKKSQCN